MTTVYLSYRRQDGAREAARLFHDLAGYLGAANLLMDVAGIEPGEHAARVVLEAVALSDALLVLIGGRWLRLRDASGERQIDNPDDFVRRETGAALALGKAVVPVLSGEARMPWAAELPDALRPLADLAPLALREASWAEDVAALAAALPARVAALPRSAPQARPGVPLALVPHVVFVSYAFTDHEIAFRLVGALEAAGHRCWIAPRDISPGSPSYAVEIARAIKGSRLMLVVSQASGQSEDVLNEVTLAKNHRVARLPVRIDRAPLSEGFEYFFSQSQWLELSPRSADWGSIVPAIAAQL